MKGRALNTKGRIKNHALNYITSRVQKKSRLHGSEQEENFALYDVFEEGFEICINNPVSGKFLYNATSTVKGIAHLQ